MEVYKAIRLDDKKEIFPVEGTKYYTLDNGGNPFRVMIEGNIVKVYKQENSTDDMADYRLILTYKPKQILIGKSIINKMTKFSGAEDLPDFDGNSILLKMGKNKYVFIGPEVYSFTSYSEIINFYSPVGNSLSPYPYAVDKEGNVYLLTFGKISVLYSSEKLHEYLEDEDNDPYNYYWNFNKKARTLKTLDFKIIQKRLY